MNALYIEKHGSVADLAAREVSKPSPGPDEVLVRIDAAGINPSDIVSVEGRFAGSMLPRVVGRDFAGVVVDGPSDLVGAAIWGSGGDLGVTRNGTHAEYLVLPLQAVARRPKNLSAEQAGAVGVPYITAFSALVTLGKVKTGEYVIVSGAAGSVGQAAIEIAHGKGARVIGLVRNSTGDWISKSGKVEAIAYSDQGNLPDVAHEVTGGKGADLALNGVGGSIFSSIIAALGAGGRQVLYSVADGREATLDILSFYKNQFVLLGLDTQKFDSIQCARILNELGPLFESGAIQAPKINESYALSQAAQAYSRVASGKTGKVVFEMSSSEVHQTKH